MALFLPYTFYRNYQICSETQKMNNNTFSPCIELQFIQNICMHRQIQISQGVYVTDFRQNSELKGVNSQIQPKVQDVRLLLDKLACNQSKIQQLRYSIEAIKQQQDWQSDQVLLEAIEQNYQRTLKFSTQMKQYILELNSVKYKPENDKVQELINATRITDRQNLLQQQFQDFLSKYGVQCKQQQENMEKDKLKITVQQQGTKAENSKENDQGIYV